MNSIHKFVTGGMAALMMSAGAFALNPSGVFAATPEAPPVPGATVVAPDAKDAEGRGLTRLLMREKRALHAQGERLRRTGEIQTRTQRFIDAQAAAGKDVAPLRIALATYTARINRAQVDHDKAKATLTAHAGFSDTGEVTDREAAKQTLKSAGADLKSSHEHLHGAGKDLAMAIKDWREANGLKPEPKETPVKP
ncbi:MAG: hypothetical protein ABIQ99_05725 [Thermoflexales bacterium]